MDEPDYDDMIDDYVDDYEPAPPDDYDDEAMMHEEFEASVPAKPSTTAGPVTSTEDASSNPVPTQVVTPNDNNNNLNNNNNNNNPNNNSNPNNENGMFVDPVEDKDETSVQDFRTRQTEDAHLYNFERYVSLLAVFLWVSSDPISLFLKC
jgi:hypothetical protein